MAKQVVFGEEMKEKLLEWVNVVGDAVCATLGPGGRNVVSKLEFRIPTITKDGYYVAREISLDDKLADVGAQLIKEAALRANETAGDGTSTSCCIAQSIINNGFEVIDKGANPVFLKRGIDKSVEFVLKELDKMAVPINTVDDISDVATISANNDRELGDLIAKAMECVGTEGVVAVEEAQGMETYLDIVEGLEFNRGLLSPFFATDMEKMTATLEDAYILIMGERLKQLKDIKSVLEVASQKKKPIIIICDDASPEALSMFVQNKMKNNFTGAIIKAPEIGMARKDILEDLATLTGGAIISSEYGIKATDASVVHLGEAKKIIITRDSTTVIDGNGRDENIRFRVKQLENQREATTSDYDKEMISQRIGKLSGGVALIKVGAPSEVEMREKKDRVEDAINATKAAVAEGIIPGGGSALAHCYKKLEIAKLNFETDDEKNGRDIVLDALVSPLETIAMNAGANREEVLKNVLTKNSKNYGWNAVTNKFGNMFKMGVIDPTKVTKSSLLNASSVAGTIITTSVMIVEEDGGRLPQMDPSMMGGMM